MLAVDLVGLIITIFAVGMRYPHYALCAAVLHDLGKILVALFLHGHITSVIAAGAFGTTTASGLKSGLPVLLFVFSGSIVNYIFSAAAGGVEYEKTRTILNPAARVKHPFAIINLRLALLSVLVNIWQLLTR